MRTASLVLCLLVGPAAAQEAPPASPAPGPAAIEVPAPAPPRASALPVVQPPPSEPPTPVAPPVAEPPPSRPPATLLPPASAQPLYPVTGAGATPEQHQHLGLFIHLDLGGVYLRTTGSRGGSNFTTQGGAAGGAVAVGWAPSDEWALGLEYWSWKSLSASGLGPETSVELQALGLNVTRYIVPAGIFATVVVSGTRLAITDSGDYAEYATSDIGFGLKVLLGKEWPVASWLRLGLAGELFLSVNRDNGETLRTFGAGLVFSCSGI